MFGVVPLICAKKSFINQADAKGEWGWGAGGAEDWFTEGQSPNYDSARFTKPCNINEIQRFAKIPHSAKSLLCDTVYYSVYSNISSNISCLRIEHYKQIRILKYSQSRAVSGILANL